MATRYEIMYTLSKNLEKLFEKCGAETKDISIRTSPKIVSLIEAIFKDDSVENYLKEINKQTVSATKALEEKLLDIWSYEEDIKQLEKENKNLLVQAEQTKQCLPIIEDIIAMRETLFSRITWAKENESENEIPIKILKNQLEETSKLLKNAGVQIMDETDEFDNKVCKVVDTVPTEDITLINTIASVFRPGYQYEDKVLRLKEVVLYVRR